MFSVNDDKFLSLVTPRPFVLSHNVPRTASALKAQDQWDQRRTLVDPQPVFKRISQNSSSSVKLATVQTTDVYLSSLVVEESPQISGLSCCSSGGSLLGILECPGDESSHSLLLLVAIFADQPRVL